MNQGSVSEGEVNPLHSRYIELTARYKAGWTFHRFLDGLQKFFGNREAGTSPVDFPSLYKSLKEASVHLNSASTTELQAELTSIAERLDRAFESLDEQDRRVSPSYLRLFFQRVRRYDDRILIEMLHFFQSVQRDRSWEADRIDKVDFLFSRLAESVAGPGLKGDRARLAKVLERLSNRDRLELSDPSRVANRLKLLDAVRAEIEQLSRFDELAAKDIVGHYRRLKHSLGRVFFDPRILPVIVDTNAKLAERISQLVEREEERIFAEYDRVSRLERDQDLDRQVLGAVAELRRKIDGFQRRVKAGTYRIDDLQKLAASLETLQPLLDSDDEPEPAEVREPAPEGDLEPLSETPWTIGDGESEALLEEDLTALAGSIAACDPSIEPERAARALDGGPLRVSARQVVAYRRLTSGGRCDHRLERFLLEVWALRVRLRRELARIHSGGDVSAADALKTADLAEWYLGQFAHLVEREALGPAPAEARPLRRQRVELMHDYSALWLALHGAG